MDPRSIPPTPPPPLPPQQPAAPVQRAKEAPRQNIEGSVKDTIEAILVAFMLAFIFRAFVVEAFVIPTGSMAPTLLGAHMRFRCIDCGYQFDVNYQGEGNQDDVVIDSHARGREYAIFCPNCGLRVPRDHAVEPENDATEPAVRYGDRILVLKYLYLFEEPQRWDVVVFKSPYEPSRYDYSQNYIKRLVGKPNESILILDGDIYVGEGDDPGTFRVQNKPRKVQQALWRIVYDNDFQPRGVNRTELRDANETLFGDPAWELPWRALPDQKGWTLSGDLPQRREFSFDNPDGSATIFYDPTTNPKKFALTDWLAYDVTENQGPGSVRNTYRLNPVPPENNVSDVMLEFFYDRHEGDGPLRVELTKLDHNFAVEIAPAGVRLLKEGQVLGEAPLPAGAGPRHVEVSNVDYCVSVRIDGKDLLKTDPQQYAPDVPFLIDAFRRGWQPPKPEVRIVGSQQRSTLSHIRLWRDIYYLNRERPNQAAILWGTPLAFPNGIMKLGPDEFFVLGDNSAVSLDARYWHQPIELKHEGLSVAPGRVPRRFMLGKAFFVYWPAGYRPIEPAPALIPNFGDMRFIH